MIPSVVTTSLVAVGYWFGLTWVNAHGWLDKKETSLPACPRCNSLCVLKDIFPNELTVKCERCDEVFGIGENDF